MDHPPGSVPAPRRTTLVAFLVLLMAVIAVNIFMVLPYVLAVIMGSILAVLAQPVLQWLTGHHVPPRVAAAVVVLGVVLVILAPLAFFVTKAIQQGIAIGQGLAEDGVSVRSLLDHVSGWAPIETLIGSPDVFETQARRWMQSVGTGRPRRSWAWRRTCPTSSCNWRWRPWPASFCWSMGTGCSAGSPTRSPRGRRPGARGSRFRRPPSP